MEEKAMRTKDIQVFFKIHYDKEVSYTLSSCESMEELKDHYIEYISQWIIDNNESRKFDDKLVYENLQELYDFEQWVSMIAMESDLVEQVEIVF